MRTPPIARSRKSLPNARRNCKSAVGDGITIHQGCDFHLSPQNLQTALREPSRFSINGLSYLLVEFPEVTLLGIDQVFSRLMSAGLTPIVTHPERNQHLAADIPRLRRWVGKGIHSKSPAGACWDSSVRTHPSGAWKC